MAKFDFQAILDKLDASVERKVCGANPGQQLSNDSVEGFSCEGKPGGAKPCIPLTFSQACIIAALDDLDNGECVAERPHDVMPVLKSAKGDMGLIEASHFFFGDKSKHSSPRTIRRQKSVLKNHLSPEIAPPIREVDSGWLATMLDQMSLKGKRETQNQFSCLVAQIIDYCATQGWIEPRNLHGVKGPDEIGHENHEHYKCVCSIEDASQLYNDIKGYKGRTPLAVLALLVLMLVGARPLEVVEMRKEELDLDKGLWFLPRSRCKTDSQHILVLSKLAVNYLRMAYELNPNSPWVFPSKYGDAETVSASTLNYILEKLGYKGRQTLHGFRGTFSTLCHEHTDAHTAIEYQLCHQVGDATSRAYNHSHRLVERKELMNIYAHILVTGKVPEKLSDIE